ncbi:glycosyltransferase family 2 protein [Patescibacteria group bacterium]|nr:glycosyltransferase family 2 protein [Patescibacteria group bacterium]MBU4458365.1 glycosyltransferase family 2 protein [Patescibacteria group bacterium]MCG2695880.1 glycosyltransferase family 2 protein [Candidatus Portnoybacteria bacterium]
MITINQKSSKSKKIFVVIPAYNEEKTIGQVIREVKKYVDNIIVVDDGSTDKTYETAKKEEVSIYHHIINRGLGGALTTGIKGALLEHGDIFLTFDADGQHKAQDIPKMVNPIKNGVADIIIGSRLLVPSKMPFSRKLANRIANIITRFLFGIWTTDSQSGLRCFNKKTAQLLNLKTNSMEVSSEIIKEIKVHNLKLMEVPIQAIYTDYSLSKGQNFILGLKTFVKLIILKLFK